MNQVYKCRYSNFGIVFLFSPIESAHEEAIALLIQIALVYHTSDIVVQDFRIALLCIARICDAQHKLQVSLRLFYFNSFWFYCTSFVSV